MAEAPGGKRPEEPPPCIRVGGTLCRGCSGWEAMVQAARPGGPWHGAVIHCPCTGLSVRFAEED